MDYHKAAFLSTTPNQERRSMSNDHNWISEIIPQKQLKEIEKSSAQIIERVDPTVRMIIGVSPQTMINLCLAWKATKEGREEAFPIVSSFVQATVDSIVEYLTTEEGINPYEEDETN